MVLRYSVSSAWAPSHSMTRGSGAGRIGSEITIVSTRIIQDRPASPESCSVARRVRLPRQSSRRVSRCRTAASRALPVLPEGPPPPGWCELLPRCCGREGLPARARRDEPRRIHYARSVWPCLTSTLLSMRSYLADDGTDSKRCGRGGTDSVSWPRRTASRGAVVRVRWSSRRRH